jgi:hypothetical protein
MDHKQIAGLVRRKRNARSIGKSHTNNRERNGSSPTPSQALRQVKAKSVHFILTV